MTKRQLQEKAADALLSCNRLVCQWATSVGKSGVVLETLRRCPYFKTLILVPEQINIQNWVDEFQKFNVDCRNVQIYCYASLHKIKDTVWDLLVLDEVPHIDTEKRRLLCNTIKAKHVLALGAVISEEEMLTLERIYGKFAVSKISLSKAVDMDILPPLEIHIMHMRLDNTVKNLWYNGKPCTAEEYYHYLKDYVNKCVDAYNAASNSFNKNRMLRAGNERKRFLGHQKFELVKRMCENLNKQGKRYICFCSSIAQAEALGGELSFTSKSKASARHLERFNNHETNALFVVGKCIEGQNLKDIDCGIIVQLGGTDRITVQEVGRVMRSDNPIVYAPVFDDTKDTSFLYTLTANVPSISIKHYNF